MYFVEETGTVSSAVGSLTVCPCKAVQHISLCLYFMQLKGGSYSDLILILVFGKWVCEEPEYYSTHSIPRVHLCMDGVSRYLKVIA